MESLYKWIFRFTHHYFFISIWQTAYAFFGVIGTLLFLIGFGFAFYLGAYKLYCSYTHHAARLITDRPSFYISLTCMVIGSMMFLSGFLGELLLRNSSIRNHYLIDKRIS